MSEAARKTAKAEPQRQPAAHAEAGEALAPSEENAMPAPLASAAGIEARQAAALRDPRLQAAGADQRIRLVRQLQRGYGNSHVARVIEQIQRREGSTEATAEERPPTEAEKAAALKAAAAAEQKAISTNTAGAGQAEREKAAKAGELTTKQTALQQAAAAKGAAKAAKQAGKAPGAAAPSAGKAKSGAGAAAPAAAPAASGDKAPTSPEEDPAFQAVVGKVKSAGAKQQAHASAGSKAKAAQMAAESPPSELGSKAQAGQVGKMQQAEAPAFDAAGFKAKLMERIEALAPKNAQDADNLKESNALGGVKGEMQGSVAQEQTKSTGPIEQQTAAAPDASGVAPKPVTPLQPAEPGAAPAVGAEGAVPKPKTPAEVEAPIKEDSQQLDQQMAQADVSEEQIKKGNEPEFQAAIDAKGEAKQHAETAPQEFRQAEQSQIAQARGEATATTQQGTQAMHADRAGILQQVGGRQTQTKSKDEQERDRIAGDIKNIYNETKASVEAKLGGLDAKVNQAFDSGAAAAKKTFEDYVEAKMNAYKEKRYGGMFGWARWLKDKVADMPGEVNVFYADGRKLYLREMDAVIDRVVAIVGATITEAKAEIARGKQRIEEYVAKLPTNLRQVGQESASQIQSQFDALEENVNNKQNELIESLAKKYQENLQAVDARIEELKAANKGLISKAKDAIGGLIKTIMQLKEMLMGVLARVADAVGKIIKDPIGFLGNLISGVKQGLLQFVDNIGTHLKKGLFTWLFGELAAGGIEIPKSFDLKGILTLVMQILGLTWQTIRAQAVKILGEPVVRALEGAFEIFKIIRDQGLGGLWEFIKDKLGDLKTMVIDGIKDMVATQVIQAGIQWLVGILGGPAGAFIKAAKAIIDIVMWFVNNGSRMLALVNSVVDSVGAIASGALGQAAGFIEKSLANAIPILIGFLASLLGLGNLSQKIKGIIEKIQQPVKKAVGWVLGKAKAFASKVMGKVKGALAGKPRSEAEKQKALQDGVMAGKAAVERLKGGKVSEALIRPVLGAIKLRYRLGLLEPFKQEGYWAVRGEINRMAVRTNLQADDDFSKAKAAFGNDEFSTAQLAQTLDISLRAAQERTQNWQEKPEPDKLYLVIATRKYTFDKTKVPVPSLVPGQHKSLYVDKDTWEVLPTISIRDKFYKKNFTTRASVLKHADSGQKTASGETLYRCENTGPQGPNHKPLITEDELEIDHTEDVTVHWNREGHNTTQDDRNSWYDNADNLQVFCKSCNRAKPKGGYIRKVGENFRGKPDNP